MNDKKTKNHDWTTTDYGHRCLADDCCTREERIAERERVRKRAASAATASIDVVVQTQLERRGLRARRQSRRVVAGAGMSAPDRLVTEADWLFARERVADRLRAIDLRDDERDNLWLDAVMAEARRPSSASHTTERWTDASPAWLITRYMMLRHALVLHVIDVRSAAEHAKLTELRKQLGEREFFWQSLDSTRVPATEGWLFDRDLWTTSELRMRAASGGPNGLTNTWPMWFADTLAAAWQAGSIERVLWAGGREVSVDDVKRGDDGCKGIDPLAVRTLWRRVR